MIKKAGATLVEICIVIAILMVLAAFLFPVFQSAKRSAKVADTMNNAHQVWVALTLYRTDWDGDGRVGTGSQMGLPILGVQVVKAVPWDSMMGTCNPKQGFAYWPDEDTGPGSWFEAVSTVDENVPLVSTETCTEAPWDTSNQYHPKLGIASLLSGSMLKKRRTGNFHRISWWLE